MHCFFACSSFRQQQISQMRMTCFKKFFRIPQELAAVKEEYARFSSCSEEFNDPDSIHDRWAVSPMTWWTNHGQSIPLLMSLAMKLLSQPASSSCCERNWSTYSFIHSVKRNALTPERAEDLVFVHSNLRHLSRRTDAYKKGETRMWDVGGDSFDSLSGVGLLEVADLSIDEPELQAVSFGLGDAEDEESFHGHHPVASVLSVSNCETEAVSGKPVPLYRDGLRREPQVGSSCILGMGLWNVTFTVLILDGRLSTNISFSCRKEMLAALNAALPCTDSMPEKRHKMKNVVEMLQEIEQD
ncbi:hypothetical protein SASPL_126367 [Salvia splendens]|uniref:HAT C-terminal dimerisation domain-containing protein n=1 Tax=Salvia splendens TaxID=180675 RepID=A0A8X8ZQX5_SALSN|nr:hypothetical protein SASPL_126367 [Salvia splendens]